MVKKILLYVNFFCFFIINSSPNHSIIKEVEKQFLSNFDWECESLHVNANWSFAEYVNNCLKDQQNLKDITKAKIVFKILNQESQRENDNIVDITTWDDLNLFRNIKNKKSVTLAQKIDRTYTHLGRATLHCMLAQPLTSIDEINKRQEILKTIINNQDLYSFLDNNFNQLKKYENLFLSFFVNDPLIGSIEEQFIKFNNNLNENENVLLLNNALDHKKRSIIFLARLCASIVLPIYGMLKILDKNPNQKFNDSSERLISSGDLLLGLTSLIKNNQVQGIVSIFAGISSALNTKQQFELIKDNFLIIKYLQEKLIQASAFLSITDEISKKLIDYPNIYDGLNVNEIYDLFNQSNKNNKKLNKLILLLKTDTFNNGSSLFSNWGRILTAYKLLSEIKYDFNKMLCVLGKIESYVSIAKLYKEFENKRVNYSFAKFVETQKPFIILEEFWNPIIDENKVVTNSVSFGLNGESNNIIITGSNKGGKSTIIRSVATNIILAQTFGLVAAKSIALPIFHKLGTYINIVDDISAGDSLFSAQIDRIKNLIDPIESLTPEKFWFIGFDEPCNGTDFIVGQATFYSIIKNLASDKKNNICMISTHSKLLPKLEQENNSFSNYKVTSYLDNNGEVKSTFRLEKGLSVQNTAIELLKSKGFDNKILNEIKTLISN
jgi:DNA mismatch repair protein MutS